MNYWPQKEITHADSPVAVTVDDRAFWSDTSGGNIIVNLPSVTGKAALYFVVKKTTSDSATVTVNAPAGKTIDGAASYILSQYSQIIGIVADVHGNFKLVDGNSSGAAVGISHTAVEKTDGDFGLGGLTGVPSTLVTVTLPIPGDVIVTVSGVAAASGQPTTFSLGVRVDTVTDYVWTGNNSLVGSGSDYFSADSVSHRFLIPNMAAGSHTFQMIASGTNMTLQAHSGEPASMIIEYNTVTNFGGGNPTSDPTNDLAGTWDTVQVVGLQNDKLPTKVAGGFLRRNLTNTGWEDVTWLNDVTHQIKLDQWATPDDITRLDVNSSRHGLTPKLPLVTGRPDVTNFLRADGTWSTPAGGGGASSGDPLGKLFFSHNSFLPNNTYTEQLYDYLATDFANLNGGTKAVSMSRARFTPGGTNVGNWGWDTGALRSKALFIMSNIRSRVNGVGLFMSDSLPSATEIPNNSYLIQVVPNDAATGTAGGISMYKRAGGSFTLLGSETKIFTNNADNFGMVPLACAFYYDDPSNRLILFIRFGNEQWYPIIDLTDSSFTTMRYFGIRNDAGTGAGANQITWTGCPMAIYYE